MPSLYFIIFYIYYYFIIFLFFPLYVSLGEPMLFFYYITFTINLLCCLSTYWLSRFFQYTSWINQILYQTFPRKYFKVLYLYVPSTTILGLFAKVMCILYFYMGVWTHISVDFRWISWAELGILCISSAYVCHPPSPLPFCLLIWVCLLEDSVPFS